MPSVEIGPIVGVGARIQIQAILGAEVAAQPMVEVNHLINQLVEQGDLAEEEGPDPEQEPVELESDPDQELLDGEDRPLHEGMEEEEGDEPAEQDLAERLSEWLLALGWPEAEVEDDGLTLAWVWEQKHPLTEEALRQALANRSASKRWDAELPHILQEFQRWAAEEKMPGKPTESMEEIRIFQDHRGNWQVEIHDPLRYWQVVNPNARIPVGHGSISLARWQEMQAHYRENLEKLAEALLEKRRNFFEAKTPGQAAEILKNQPLERKQMAERIGVNASTVSRWCNKGLRVGTPHGVYPLKAFFALAVRGLTEKVLARDGLLRIIAVALRECPKANSLEIGAYLQKQHDLKINERSQRRYLKPVKDTVVMLEEAPDEFKKSKESLLHWIKTQKIDKSSVFKVAVVLLGINDEG
ncbi:MAG: hypothetical protein IPL99_09000 [Candidatus Competibacteraceae bacterium]|nr:hypothetical protein [Candidatus Competibacteraceae bacterium]